MAYEICNRCGRMFNKNGKICCLECLDQIENEKSVIRAYLTKNPKPNICDIVNHTGISIKSINYLISGGSFKFEEEVCCKDLEKKTLVKMSDRLLQKKRM